MKFDYNDVLSPRLSKVEVNETITEREIVEKYKKGEYRIVTEQARYPLANIKSIFEKYNLTPDYQRRRVWDNKRKSKFKVYPLSRTI